MMNKKTLRAALMNQQLKTEIVRHASDVKQEVKKVFLIKLKKLENLPSFSLTGFLIKINTETEQKKQKPDTRLCVSVLFLLSQSWSMIIRQLQLSLSLSLCHPLNLIVLF